MSISVHLGAHKTATTHLQRSIRLIEPLLIKQNVLFLGPDSLRNRPLGIIRSLDDMTRMPKRFRTVRRLMRSLLSAHSDCLLSDELILGGLNPVVFLGDSGQIYTRAERRLNNLLELLGTTDVTLFLALRSPANFLTSAFGEALRFGGDPDPAEYFGDFQPTDLRWSELVTRIMRSGATKLVCWRFEDLADVRHEMLTRMLGGEFAAMIPDLHPLRPGLSQAAYDMILASGESDPPMARRKLIRNAMRKYPKTPDVTALSIFDEAVHDECDRIYADDCIKIAAIPQVEFLFPDGFGSPPA